MTNIDRRHRTRSEGPPPADSGCVARETPVDLRGWLREAEGVAADVLAGRHPHPFLLLYEAIEIPTQQLGAWTPLAAESRSRAGALRVCPLVTRGATDTERVITIGRGASCDIVLMVSCASALHARFEILDTTSAAVTDEGSRNGTRVNGEYLERGATVRLRSGDEVSFGSTPAKFLCPRDLHAVLLRVGRFWRTSSE